jgi:hypothetical protein
MEQSTLAVCRAVKFVLIILPQLIWGHIRRRAKFIERPERQLAVSEFYQTLLPFLVVTESLPREPVQYFSHVMK